MGSLRSVDAVIIIVYFAVMALLGMVAHKKTETSEDFFVAGKTLGTFSLAAMWLSSWIGGASIVGTANNAYALGISGGWYVTILAIGCVIFGLTFSKLAKRLGDKLQTVTYPAFVASRYDKRSGDVVIISCFLANVGFLASQLVAMGAMLNTVTGWSYGICFIVSAVITVFYTAFGGLLSVAYTTWVTFSLTMLGTVFLGIPLAAKAAGGFGQVAALPAEWFDIGRYGWPTIIALAVSSVFSFFTSMDSYTRSFAAKTEKASRNGAVWAGVGVLLIAFGATYVGMAAKVVMPDLPEGSSAYAAMVANYFPAGVAGLVLCGVFAAIMDTGVVCINCCAANISMDIYHDRINPNAPDKTLKRLGVVSSLGVGVIGTLLAWWKQDIIDLLLLALTFQASSLFFPTVLGAFWKKPTARASSVSMAVSLAVVLVWLLGGGLGWGGIFSVDALWPGLISSGVVFIVMTIFGKPTEEDVRKAEDFCDAK